MKIFEITTLKEADLSQLSQQIQTLVGNISSKVQSITAQQPATDNNAGGADNAAQSTASSPRQMIDDAAARVRSGEAQLSRDIDAELGKTGVDAQQMHIQIVRKIQKAGRDTAEQIFNTLELPGSRRERVYDSAGLAIQIAAFGYMNKKYLNGDDQNFEMNTMDMIRQIVASNQPRGGAQPAGRQSSARPNGQRGTVPSGGGTNALDAMAADNF